MRSEESVSCTFFVDDVGEGDRDVPRDFLFAKRHLMLG